MQTGIIFDIQHYTIQDGPGIRTTVFLKGCPLRCSWCCNPESQMLTPQIRYGKDKCSGCRRCIGVCQHSAISESASGIEIDFRQCNLCEEIACEDSCPHNALRVTGKRYTVAEVVDKIARDIHFYKNSGGGVTLSGGEPLVQTPFLLEILKECKKLCIHTALETCGYAPENSFIDILPYTDLFLYDIKLVDAKLHKLHTGMSNEPILSNLSKLASSGKTVIIRLPLIPGITDTSSNLENIAEIAINNRIREIDLEPYHFLGIDKYQEFGIVNRFNGCVLTYTSSQLKIFQKFFVDRGLTVELM